jgi:hypothetical protein
MKRIVTCVVIVLSIQVAVRAANLQADTTKAWEQYVDSATRQMQERAGRGKTYLWVDESPDRLTKVRAGEIVVAPIGPENPKKVASGLIHHWVGATFIPHVSRNNVLQVVRDYARYKELYQPAVIDSRVIATSEATDRFSMLLMNKALFVKTALDTDYECAYIQVDERRGYSISRTTRIQEIEEYGAPSQRVLQEGEGNGLIWRLSSIVRWEEREGGVYIEIEAMALSREIPASLRWIAEPIVRRVSRNSLATSLKQTQDAVASATILASQAPPRSRCAGVRACE